MGSGPGDLRGASAGAAEAGRESKATRPGDASRGARPLLWLGLAAALRLALAAGLFLAAAQVSPQDPLGTMAAWCAAPDAVTYHNLADRLEDFWEGRAQGVNLKLPPKHMAYPLLLSGVYRLLGDHPLWAALMNALAFLGAGLLARRLALRLGRSPGAALAVGLVVCLWPPSLTYGSLPLKDALVLLSGLLLLAGTGELLPGGGDARPRPPLGGLAVLGGTWLGLALRPDLGWLLAAWGGLAALAALALGWGRPQRLAWARGLVLAALVGAGLLLGQVANPTRLLEEVPSAKAQAARAAQATEPALPAAPAAPKPPPLEPDPPALASPGPGWLKPLWQRRWEYATTGGVSLSPEAHMIPAGPGDWAVMLWGAARDLLLFPYPWQRFPAAERLSPAGAALTGWQLIWYAALPGLVWGLLRGLKPRAPAAPLAWAVGLWLLVMGLGQALVVVNLGTLFRLRDLAFLPWLVFFFSDWYGNLLGGRE